MDFFFSAPQLSLDFLRPVAKEKTTKQNRKNNKTKPKKQQNKTKKIHRVNKIKKRGKKAKKRKKEAVWTKMKSFNLALSGSVINQA